MKLPIGILYLSLHNQLSKNASLDGRITRKKCFEILGKHYLVPKNIRDLILIEMEKIDLIKRESKDCILVLNCGSDLENDANKFYKMVGII